MSLLVAVRDCLDPLENELRLDHDRVLDPGFRHGRVLDTGSGRRRGLDLGLCCDHVRDPLATAGHSCGSNQHLVPYRHRRLLCLRNEGATNLRRLIPNVEYNWTHPEQ